MNTYLRILSYARPWRRFVPGYLVFSVLAVIFSIVNMAVFIPMLDVIFDKTDIEELSKSIALPKFYLSVDYFKEVFNYYMYQIVLEYGKFGSLVFVCIVVIASFSIANLFKYLSAVIMAKAKAITILNMRTDIYKSVSNLHVGFFTETKKGDIISRISNDIQQIESSISHNLRIVFREPLLVIGYFAFLIYLSPGLTLFTLIMLPFAGYIISAIAKRLKKVAAEAQESLGRQMNILDETISGMRVIKAFNAVGYINRVFSNEVRRYASADYGFSKRYELSSPVSEILGAISIVGILFYGGDLVLNKGSIDGSSFIVFIAAFTQILQPTKAIAGAVTHFQRGIASGDRVFEIVDTKSEIVNKPNPKQLETFEKEIEFKNVSFSYGSKKVLDNISFKVPRGKTVALVGPSGGGKSTLANLIPRFYDPDEGELLIDGVSLKDYDFNSVRAHMGIVTQESILFNDTIKNNIAFGLDHFKDEEVCKAAEIAHADEFIVQEPEGYQRVIGERGSKLSGGQRQRLTIARALLKNPSILILDEATSALDSESEMLVQDAINSLMKSRTSIVIAHRLSTIQNADEILVINEGKIVERGTHSDLMKQDGIYQKLTAMQGL
ncbi:MAG: ABC transporter ATP-binding protein/permease [Cytophagales bacterium]|nr:ABC transporter ATP-binding protein/permease [Cytophagales bacterium]